MTTIPPPTEPTDPLTPEKPTTKKQTYSVTETRIHQITAAPPGWRALFSYSETHSSPDFWTDPVVAWCVYSVRQVSYWHSSHSICQREPWIRCAGGLVSGPDGLAIAEEDCGCSLEGYLSPGMADFYASYGPGLILEAAPK